MRRISISLLFLGIMVSVGFCKTPLEYRDLLADFKSKFQIHVVLDSKPNKIDFADNENPRFLFLPDVSSGTGSWLKLNQVPDVSGDLVESLRCFGQGGQGLIQIFLSRAGTKVIWDLMKRCKDRKIAFVYNNEVLQKVNIEELNPNTALGMAVEINSKFRDYSHLFFPVSILEKLYIKAVEME